MRRAAETESFRYLGGDVRKVRLTARPRHPKQGRNAAHLNCEQLHADLHDPGFLLEDLDEDAGPIPVS